MKTYTKNWYYTCNIRPDHELCGDHSSKKPDCGVCADYIAWKRSGLTIEEFSKITRCGICGILLTKETKSRFYTRSCKKCAGEE